MQNIAWVDDEQVRKVAARLKMDPPETQALNFYSFPGKSGGPEVRAEDMYPEVNHPQALDFFFFGCLHDYGFWYGSEKGYLEPLFGQMAGKKRKGSDLLWRLLKRAFDLNPGLFIPESLANVTPVQLTNILTDDVGTQWPDFDHRLVLSRQWGRWLIESGLTHQKIIELANGHPVEPLGVLLYLLRTSPFGRDPMMKKAVLLAMVLHNRPERFLKVSDRDTWPAIVDYHLMRVSLRLGMVKLGDAGVVSNVSRSWVPAPTEQSIREATRIAVTNLQNESGLTHGQLDNILWQARGFCPEMETPKCEKCLFSSVCAKRIELFQPVIRTDAY